MSVFVAHLVAVELTFFRERVLGNPARRDVAQLNLLQCRPRCLLSSLLGSVYLLLTLLLFPLPVFSAFRTGKQDLTVIFAAVDVTIFTLRAQCSGRSYGLHLEVCFVL